MIFDFVFYQPGSETRLAFTATADSEDAARRDVHARLLALGIGPLELADWKVAVTIVRKGRP